MTRARRHRIGSGTLVLGLAAAACGGGPQPPSILLVSIDTLRQDHVSAYGYERATTPRIDALAAEGALFLNAVSTSNWTLPAHMSLVTGLPPSLHRVEDDGSRLSEGLRTLAEVLSDEGYATGGVTSHVYVGKQFGFERGFDHFATRWNQPAETVTDQALDWLDGTGERPFFLFLHYFDPHWNFAPAEPFASRFGAGDPGRGDIEALKRYFDRRRPMPVELVEDVGRLYDAEIAYTDHHLGRLFDRLEERGRLDRTIVAVVSDHGEELGEHGSFGHGTHLFGEVTRIPFVLRYPAGVPAGPRGGVASLADVPHTLLALAGLEVPEQFALWGADLGRADATERAALIESTRWGPKRFAVQRADAKLLSAGSYTPVYTVHRGGASGDPRATAGAEREKALEQVGPFALEPACFDLAADPGEQHNLFPGGETGELAAALAGYLERSQAALRLTVSAPDGGEYALELECAAGFVDEVFSADPGAVVVPAPAEGAAPAAARDPAREGLRLGLSAEPVTLYLPLDAGALELRLRLVAPDGTASEARVALPPPGASTVVPFPDSGGGPGAPRAVLERGLPLLDAGLEAADLGEADLEWLRALGYVR